MQLFKITFTTENFTETLLYSYLTMSNDCDETAKRGLKCKILGTVCFNLGRCGTDCYFKIRKFSSPLQHSSRPLHVASQGNSEIVQLLLKAGAEVDAKDEVRFLMCMPYLFLLFLLLLFLLLRERTPLFITHLCGAIRIVREFC